jgi:hypothetical protein
LVFLGVLATTTPLLYFWHRATIAAPVPASPAAFLQSSAEKVVRFDAFIPTYPILQETVRGNLVQWGLVCFALALLSRRLWTRDQVVESYSALALAFPLLSLVFYRNAFPYFYTFIMPPALVLCAFTFDRLASMDGPRGCRCGHMAWLATAAIGVSVLAYALVLAPDGRTTQRQVIAAVHEIFPEPVPYIDWSGMVSSFPKVGFFMSSWGTQRYRAANKPVFADLLRARQPKFVLANSPMLSSALATGRSASNLSLLEEDAAVLRGQFIQYWGPIYVVGTRVLLDPGGAAVWELLVPGSYRLESELPVFVNGSIYSPGSTIPLGPGAVSLRSDVRQEVVLRTSDAGSRPSYPVPKGPLLTGFPSTGPRFNGIRSSR